MSTPAPRNEMPIESVADPVCGAVLRPADAAQTYEYHNQTYYFDSAECLKRFLDDPEKFAENSADEMLSH